MKLSTDRILTTHVGSLPRSAPVCDLLIAKEKGKPYDAELFERTMRDEIAAVVKRQVATGIDVVSDGETAKIGYSTYMQERLTGFGGHVDRKPATDLAEYPELRKKLAVIMGPQEFNRASCIGPIAVKTLKPLERDIANFRAALQGSGATEGFLNAASPGVVSAFQINKYYKSHAEYLQAIAAAMKPEYDAIVKAGFLLQIDCPDLAMARHTGFQDLSEAEFLARTEENVAALNAALAEIPADRVRIHICWGNYEGPHDHDIDLAKVLPAILKVKAQAIAFEAANPRHDHEWAVWKAANLPDDKVLIPGVLDTCTNYVEHPELVAQRLCRFADIVGRERVLGGTDCGFGTFAGYGKVDPEVAYKKLAALVDGARLASRQLWAR